MKPKRRNFLKKGDHLEVCENCDGHCVRKLWFYIHVRMCACTPLYVCARARAYTFCTCVGSKGNTQNIMPRNDNTIELADLFRRSKHAIKPHQNPCQSTTCHNTTSEFVPGTTCHSTTSELRYPQSHKQTVQTPCRSVS